MSSTSCTRDLPQRHPHRAQAEGTSSEELSMGQLDVSPPPECSEDGDGSPRTSSPKTGSPRTGSPWTASPKTGSPKTGSPSHLQLALSFSTPYQGYDTYIEDGLICLKHKIRNMEKRKIKLEDYMNRLKHGQTLNKDQLEAVEKYDELVHNVAFAQQLHKTLEGLTQDLLEAQRKASEREHAARAEAEQRRLRTVLQVQHLLQSLQHEHVRDDLLSGGNGAPLLPSRRLQSLRELTVMLGAKRSKKLSLEKQMERAAVVYQDLLEGRDKPVAGTTFKILKEQINELLHCGYFDRIPLPLTKSVKEAAVPVTQKTEALLRTNCLPSKPTALSKLKTNDSLNKEIPPIQNWKAEFQAIKDQEPPDSWDMEFSDKPVCPEPVVHKPLKGAAGFIPKVPGTIKKRAANPKQQRREKKSRGDQQAKVARHANTPVEVYNLPSALPKDPILRKQYLEDLITKIRGSFSFMQDSDLDGETSPTDGHARLGRRSSGSPSPLAQRDLNQSPVEVLPKPMHSTPLPCRLHERKASLTNGDQPLDSCDLDFATEDLDPLQLSSSPAFPSPPLYDREPSITHSQEEKPRPRTPVVSESGKQSPCNGVVPRTPTQGQAFPTPTTRSTLDMASPARFGNIHSVFKVNAPLPPNGDLDYSSESGLFAEANSPQYITASTQTPPEFAPPEDELLQPAYQSEYMVGNGGQILWPPGQSGSNMGRSGQSYYARGSVRGGFEGYRCGLRSPGGGFAPQAHPRDSGPVLYGARDTGYQHSYKRGGGAEGRRHNSSAGWSDSSQVSSPDREAGYTLVDSAHGDSLSVSTVEVPVTPQGHPAHTLLPMHLYPVPQPLRVAFTSARTVNFAPGTLDQPIAFDLLHSNLGDMFDTQAGRFTCPANGTYVFIFHILKLAVNVPLYVNLMRNEEVMVSAYANDGAPDHETASNHAILPLYHGDQVWLRLHRGAIYGSSWKYSTFSGFLLYQD